MNQKDPNPLDETQPSHIKDPQAGANPAPLHSYQQIPINQEAQPAPVKAQKPLKKAKRAPKPQKQKKRGFGCSSILLAGFILLLLYFFMPLRTNILLLGTDSREPGDSLGRTDTIIMTTIVPLRPDVKMLSIPRDLWLDIPNVGEQRINTAFFFAEAAEPGSGVDAVIETIDLHFGVKMDYYALIQFVGIVDVVDALGGVDVYIPRPMGGYDTGTYNLNGTEMLALVRDRSGSDDFFRMERGQIAIKALLKALRQPDQWEHFPTLISLLPSLVETNVPFWQWPRLGLALLRIGPDGIDSRSITRDYVFPFTTSGGANVLGPNWELINPLVDEVFK